MIIILMNPSVKLFIKPIDYHPGCWIMIRFGGDNDVD
jgi:hypothetical protein